MVRVQAVLKKLWSLQAVYSCQSVIALPARHEWETLDGLIGEPALHWWQI